MLVDLHAVRMVNQWQGATDPRRSLLPLVEIPTWSSPGTERSVGLPGLGLGSPERSRESPSPLVPTEAQSAQPNPVGRFRPPPTSECIRYLVQSSGYSVPVSFSADSQR